MTRSEETKDIITVATQLNLKHVRRNSTGIIPSRYLSVPLESCHNSCISGSKHNAALKPSRSMDSTQVEILKQTTKNLKSSQDSIDKKKKPQVIPVPKTRKYNESSSTETKKESIPKRPVLKPSVSETKPNYVLLKTYSLRSQGGLSSKKMEDSSYQGEIEKRKETKNSSPKHLVSRSVSLSPRKFEFANKLPNANSKMSKIVKDISHLKMQKNTQKKESDQPVGMDIPEKILHVVTSMGYTKVGVGKPQSLSPSASSENKTPRRDGIDLSPPRRLSFSRGKIVDLEPEDTTLTRLKLKSQISPEGKTNKFEAEMVKLVKNGGVDEEKGNEGSDINPESVVLRHQEVEVKTESETLLNNVIASKLAEDRRSKVKALVGLFESVIAGQDSNSAGRYRAAVTVNPGFTRK